MGEDQREEAAPREVAAVPIKHTAFSPPELLGGAARAIVEAHRGELPDLREAVIVLPSLHAAPEFARALCKAAELPSLLLPPITTLTALAAEVALDKPVITPAARQAMLYRVLVERGWLKGADLWNVAAELSLLFDELTRNAVQLPGDVREFTGQLERAYRARSGAGFNFEARLVHELWHAANAQGEALDPAAAYPLRLTQLAETLSVPLYAVGLEELSLAELEFLERSGRRVPVHCFDADPAADDALMRTFAAAWPSASPFPDLLERSEALVQSVPESALAGRFRVFAAVSAEQEAQAVDVTVREWLLEGRTSIGVVVNDRVTARRARALLERAEVLVEDEAGWAFSTTSAATAIGRWLDIAANEAYYRDLLDLLKSPFAFSDLPREARHAAVWRLEAYARDKSVVSGLQNFLALAKSRGDSEVAGMLQRVERGLAMLGRGRRPIARWLDALVASLDEIGVTRGFAEDTAGEQLLELFARLRHQLSDEPLAIPYAEWRRWLARELETAAFRDRAIRSPVVFTHLGAAQLRRFNAVLLLGCDAAHFPGADPATLFFNQAVRAELGLSTNVQRVSRLERQLAALLASCEVAVATWQCRSPAGEPNLLSPQLERLTALHALAYGGSLEDRELGGRLHRAEVHFSEAPQLVATAVPGPRIPRELIPGKISASGYNSLMACPYQFYARYVLGLAELDDVQEELEKRDYGQLVHDVLARFHSKHPRILDLDPAEAVRALETLSEQAFSDIVSRNYLERAWLMRWLGLIGRYVEWQRSREQEGWSWHAAEVARDVVIETPGGRKLTLRGRLDRVDTNAGGTFAVVDYKTQRSQTLKEKLQAPGEDVQLAVYALLWDGEVDAAMFLSMEREGVVEVGVDRKLSELAEATRTRLGAVYDALHGDGVLTAQGVEAVCEYCEVRGLCRRNFWP